MSRPEPGSLSSTMLTSFEKLPNRVQAVIQDSYYVPSPAERGDIQAVLDSAEEKRKHAIDSTASRIEENLERLYKSSLSAARRIPREILEDLILAWWSGLKGAERGWSYYRNLTTIMLVCRRWRDVVQSHQQLWSNLYINNQTARQGPKRLECLIQAHKRFCPVYPWSVDLMKSLDNCPSHPEALVNLLLDTRDRWCHLTLGINKFTQMLFAPPCRFPLLSRLAIYDIGEISGIHLAPSDVPALREVTLSYFKPILISLPWSQLTALMIDRIAERDLGPLIFQLTTVSTLRLDLHQPIATSSSLTYETTHALRNLCLSFPDDYTPLNITLQRMRVPHLQSLQLIRVEDMVFSGFETFLSYPPHRSLVSLSLKIVFFDYFNAQNLINILSQLPDLQSLRLSTWMRGRTFEGSTVLLEHLQQLDKAECNELKLCRKLSSLALNCLEFSDITLGETLRIRRDSLRTVELTLCVMLRGDVGKESEKIFDEHRMRSRLSSYCQDGQWLKISHLARHTDIW